MVSINTPKIPIFGIEDYDDSDDDSYDDDGMSVNILIAQPQFLNPVQVKCPPQTSQQQQEEELKFESGCQNYSFYSGDLNLKHGQQNCQCHNEKKLMSHNFNWLI